MAAACAAVMNLMAIARHSGGISRVNVGTIQGGTGRNVVPDHALIQFEVRGETTRINQFMEREVSNCPNMKLVASLGMKRYLSAVKYARFVLGNSSSGIIEVPSLGVPTINIGDRQKGRIMAKSIISCEPERQSIMNAMEQAMKMEPSACDSPYGNGSASEKIVEIIRDYFKNRRKDLKKTFYDIPYEIEK